MLAFTSATYGPRLVRNFMTDRVDQFVRGASLGSSSTYYWSCGLFPAGTRRHG
ncbi:MAG: hypothetical protein ACOYD0_02580 [Candidatus Nanopelagicales bacterium]